MKSLTRRDFGRLAALAGTAALFPGEYDVTAAPLPPMPSDPGEPFWRDVRARFLVPRDLAFLNAANLCPASLPAIEALDQNVRLYEASPSPEVRSDLMARGREDVARSPRRGAARDAGGNRHHAQHDREQQRRVERPRSEGRRRSRRVGRQPSEQSQRVAAEGRALRLHRRQRADSSRASWRGRLRRSLHEGVHAAHEAGGDHARQQQLRRPAAGRGDLRRRARARHPVAGRRRAGVRRARPRS